MILSTLFQKANVLQSNLIKMFNAYNEINYYDLQGTSQITIVY